MILVSRLGDKDVVENKDAFFSIDKDFSGSIDLNEMEKAMEQLN